MYGELISRPVPSTKTGQAPSRQCRATPSVLNILVVYLVSSSGVAIPSLTSEGSAMSPPFLGSAVWGIDLPVAHPGTGREWYRFLYFPQIQSKHHHRAWGGPAVHNRCNSNFALISPRVYRKNCIDAIFWTLQFKFLDKILQGPRDSSSDTVPSHLPSRTWIILPPPYHLHTASNQKLKAVKA